MVNEYLELDRKVSFWNGVIVGIVAATVIWIGTGVVAYAQIRDFAMSDTFTVFGEPGANLAAPTLQLAEQTRGGQPMPATTIKVGYGERPRVLVWHRANETVVYLTLTTPDDLARFVQMAVERAATPKR